MQSIVIGQAICNVYLGYLYQMHTQTLVLLAVGDRILGDGLHIRLGHIWNPRGNQDGKMGR